MTSRKPSAKAKQIAEFKSHFDDLDDIFLKEKRRKDNLAAQQEEALREKACTSKNRYASRADAEEAIRSCADYGTTNLHCYQCPYCNGWHLTSKPEHV